MAHQKLKSGCKNRPGGALQLRLSSTVSAPRAHQVSSQLTIFLLKNDYFIEFNRIDCISWFQLTASYVLGNKIAKNRDCPFNNLGKPQFFYEIVQSWVAFKLVQVLQKFGLNPKFKRNLDKWSKEMHCVVQFLKKIPQQDDEKKRAQVCLDILFHPKK
jgi:hypothetical protein